MTPEERAVVERVMRYAEKGDLDMIGVVIHNQKHESAKAAYDRGRIAEKRRIATFLGIGDLT